jgi:hypothetical protein
MCKPVASKSACDASPAWIKFCRIWLGVSGMTEFICDIVVKVVDCLLSMSPAIVSFRHNPSAIPWYKNGASLGRLLLQSYCAFAWMYYLLAYLKFNLHRKPHERQSLRAYQGFNDVTKRIKLFSTNVSCSLCIATYPVLVFNLVY